MDHGVAETKRLNLGNLNPIARILCPTKKERLNIRILVPPSNEGRVRIAGLTQGQLCADEMTRAKILFLLVGTLFNIKYQPTQMICISVMCGSIGEANSFCALGGARP